MGGRRNVFKNRRIFAWCAPGFNSEARRAVVSPDGLEVSLTLDKLVPGRVYDLRPSNILSAAGEPLTTGMAAYTLNRLR